MRSLRTQKSAFTLIELLVVIAIIAILAAILFPVFAQARGKARSAACLSNVKQMGTAMQMYIQDYDETTPMINGGSDYWGRLYPYVKNIQLFLCPDRNEPGVQNLNVDGVVLQMPRITGYGYNWGPIGWRGGGLMQGNTTQGGVTTLLGQSMASIQFPAETFAFGDTYDTPRPTIGISFSADTWRGTSNDSLRHFGGQFNYGFVDGHAKSIKVKAGFMTGAFGSRFIMVADNGTLAERAYCADPDAQIVKNTVGSIDGTNIPSPIRCGDIVRWINTNYAVCAAGATGGNCRFQ